MIDRRLDKRQLIRYIDRQKDRQLDCANQHIAIKDQSQIIKKIEYQSDIQMDKKINRYEDRYVT